MKTSPPIAAYLDELERSNGRPLSRRTDLALLCEVASRSGKEKDLDEIAFLGKFVVRSIGIMRRIGGEAEGYARFAAESGSALERIRGHCLSLTEELPPAARDQFAGRYLAQTPEGLQELLQLLQDAGRHQNWLIDHPGQSPWPQRIP